MCQKNHQRPTQRCRRRRRFLLAVFGFGVFLNLCFATLGTAQESSGQPNVILLMADDLGWGDLPAFNVESPIHAPHLTDMAEAGLKLTRFYSAAPVCSPTRGSCLTGRHPHRYGVFYANSGHLPDEEVTLPEMLREHGYATGHFGKWHLGTLTTEIQDANRGGPRGKQHFSTPQMNGFDRCFATESKVPTFDPMFRPRIGAAGTGWEPLTDFTEAVRYGTRYWNEQGRVVTGNLQGDDSRVIMDRALAFIETAVEAKTPFFATIWFHAPHLPVVAGPEHTRRYADEDVYTRNYYGCITALDEQVGRLRKQLRAMGVAENSMVWFCSDNGPEGTASKAPGSAGPFRGRKRSLYEGGVRVPGILEWPAQIAAGTETDVPCVTSDYLPTVLDVVGLQMPDQRPIDGISLLPILKGNQKTRGQAIGFQSRQQRSWVTDQYKLYSSDAGKSWELYDLLSDPRESKNMASEHPQVVRQLSEQLLAWIESCAASQRENSASSSTR